MGKVCLTVLFMDLSYKWHKQHIKCSSIYEASSLSDSKSKFLLRLLNKGKILDYQVEY